MGNEVSLVVDDELALHLVDETYATVILEAVQSSVEHLSPWMIWASDGYDADDVASFLRLVAEGSELAYAIWTRDGTFHGLCGLNGFDRPNRTANLGYWLRTGSTGLGLATRAAQRLLHHGLTELELERVEVLTSVANVPSRKVAQRLELHEEGIRARAIRLRDGQHDVHVFAGLATDVRSVP